MVPLVTNVPMNSAFPLIIAVESPMVKSPLNVAFPPVKKVVREPNVKVVPPPNTTDCAVVRSGKATNRDM